MEWCVFFFTNNILHKCLTTFRLELPPHICVQGLHHTVFQNVILKETLGNCGGLLIRNSIQVNKTTNTYQPLEVTGNYIMSAATHWKGLCACEVLKGSWCLGTGDFLLWQA